MDTPQQYPTMWTTGYVGGVKVSFTFPIRNEMEAYAQAKAITDKLLADGFTTEAPGLEAGEEREVIVTVMRRAKPKDETVIIDFYTEWGAGTDEPFGTYKYQHLYMDKDKPEMIAEFLKFSGFKSIEDIPLYDGQNPLKRTFGKKHPKETAVPTPFKIVKKQGAEKTGSDGKVFRPWEFVRYETVSPTPPTQPPAAAAPAPVTTGTAPVISDPPRVAELRNEELTITRIEPSPRSHGWLGYGKFEGIETVVHLFAPEDPNKVTEAGYKWVTNGAVHWPVILTIKDNRIRIDTVTPKTTENAAKANVVGINRLSEAEQKIIMDFMAQPIVKVWKEVRDWLLIHVYDNKFHMEKSIEKWGKQTNGWKGMSAGEVMDYLENRHKEETQPQAVNQ